MGFSKVYKLNYRYQIMKTKEEIRIYMKKYREQNNERIKKLKKIHYQKNRKQIRKKQTEYRKNNNDKIKKQKRQFYQDNREKLKEKARGYYDLTKNQEYRKNNIEKVRKWKRDYYRNDINNEKIKAKSRAYAHKINQRDTECKKCGSTKKLQFHHTNYEKREGFTLCFKCHIKEHKKIR